MLHHNPHGFKRHAVCNRRRMKGVDPRWPSMHIQNGLTRTGLAAVDVLAQRVCDNEVHRLTQDHPKLRRSRVGIDVQPNVLNRHDRITPSTTTVVHDWSEHWVSWSVAVK